MAIREKAKNFFRRGSRGDSLSKTSTNDSSRERYPSNVYKPGEPMPPPKYRRPPQKEHKEKLEAFSFSDAWRKKSFQSAYSPMGTRAHSRRNSALSVGKKSSVMGKSRSNSVTSADTEKTGSRQPTVTAPAPKLTVQSEQEGDDDVANVGLSRPRTAEDKHAHTNGLHKTISTAHDHQPFSEQDLALALQRSNRQVEAEA